ncbi:MAG: hypothetical protein ACK5L5_05245 [Bacteroidales bacterium]
MYGGLRLDASFGLSRKIDLVLSGGAKSIFNGNMLLLNTGLNVLNGNVGVRYYPKAYEFNSEKHHFIGDYIWSVDVFAGVGKCASGVGDSTRTFVQTYSLGLNSQVSNYNKVGIIADLFTDFSDNATDGKSAYSIYGAGAALAHELMLGRLAILTHVGYLYYTDAPAFNDEKIYYRAGLRYRFLKNTSFNISLRSYLTQAINIEFGINQRIVLHFKDRVSGYRKRESLIKNLGF